MISHLKQISDSQWLVQTNEEHSKGVALLAEQFASEFGCSNWGRVLGELHDKGKEQSAFQKYISYVSGYCTQYAPRENHANVGALIAKQLYPKGFSDPLQYAIAGHHAGLADNGELRHLMEKSIPDNVTIPSQTVPLMLPDNMMQYYDEKDLNHWYRMLFSCLVDADYLDTESFMNPDDAAKRGTMPSLQTLAPKLEAYLQSIKERAPASHVNDIRSRIQQRCRVISAEQPGFFSLNVPTGGGKTLSSLVWAVQHALQYNKKRIIIVIPYTSIISQTAQILRTIFGEECVLEHDSQVDYSEDEQLDDKDNNKRTAMRLATENWDYPIVVTTNVQLFESLFSNRPSRCRKLHNICNSVMILDEIQTLPVDYLQPIVDSLQTYQKLFGVSVLFTTASMPAIKEDKAVEEEYRQYKKTPLYGIPNVRDIIPEEWQLQEALRRVELRFCDDSPMSYDEVAERMCRHDRVLCIVNTRGNAREIFTRLPKEGITLHLSKMMHAEHIKRCIDTIAHALKEKEPRVIRVVATQLVEAGVDLDFPVVMREQIGLDSIMQAAGRCNREGSLSQGYCEVFALQKPVPSGYMSHCNDARKNMADIDDWQSSSAMKEYFLQLYCRTTTFDIKQIGENLYKPALNFKQAAEDFRYIDDKDQITIVIDCSETHEDMLRLQQVGPYRALMRRLMRYSVAVNKRSSAVEALQQHHQLKEVADGLYATDAVNYDEYTGLFFNDRMIKETIIV